MSQPIKIDSSLEGPLFQDMGSFWTVVFSEQDKVRVLLDAAMRNQVIDNFKKAVHNMAGNATLGSLVSHLYVPFRSANVIQAGMHLYDDPEREFTYGTVENYQAQYGNFRIQYFALPLNSVLPFIVHAPGRVLLLGVDFFVLRNLIYFRQDPRKLFPDSNYLVARGVELNYRSYLTYYTQTFAPGADDMVVKYLRTAQTPQHFKLALCGIGGMGIIRQGGVLNAITTAFDGTVTYTFDTESVSVNYRHTPLEIGTAYPPLTVIGDLIQVYQGSIKDTGWWRQVDWKGGFLLDPIVDGFHNLPVADRENFVAYVAGQDSGSIEGSRVHARVALSNDFARELPYWEKVASRETNSHYYFNNFLQLPEEADGGDPTINDTYAKLIALTEEANQLNPVLGLPPEQPDFRSLPGSKLVNPLDVFFQALLGQVAFVVIIDQLQVQRQREIFDFLGREMPTGATPIIMGIVSGIMDDSANLDDDLEIEETVAFNEVTENTYLAVTDEVELDTLVTETVVIAD